MVKQPKHISEIEAKALLFVLALGGLLLLGHSLFTAGSSHAAPTNYPLATAANASRPCAFDGITTSVVATSSTSAKTAAVVSAGSVRVFCTQDVHMKMGAVGVTGVTATTGDIPVPGYGPEYFYSAGGSFAFIRMTADGSCYVSSCK